MTTQTELPVLEPQEGAAPDGGSPRATVGEAATRGPSATSIRFVVFGAAAPQGSKRHVGRGVMVESSKKVKPWREAVKYAARMEIDARPGWTPLDGPIFASMVFTFARPRSHYRTGRNAHLIRDAAPARPTSPPDICKIARSTEDAIVDAGLIVDDARIVEYFRLAKVWVREDRDALDVPGVRIEVRQGIR